MQLRAELVHAETGVRVVQLSAWQDGECLGSTLAEAASVELAEQQAEAKLRQRLGVSSAASPPSADADAPAAAVKTTPKVAPSRQPVPSEHTALPMQTAPPEQPELAAQPAATSKQESNSTPAEPAPLDPEDWSDELAQIDLQLQRLGWSREQEGVYLERAFGHPSRSRLTTYADLVAYSQALASFPLGGDPAAVAVPLRRRDLLSQCDQLLAQLHWQPSQGRAFLEQHFQLSSRRQLNDEQLLHFNMLLEGEVMAVASAHPSTPSGS